MNIVYNTTPMKGVPTDNEWNFQGKQVSWPKDEILMDCSDESGKMFLTEDGDSWALDNALLNDEHGWFDHWINLLKLRCSSSLI